ncbi:hypothetical protein, partial [Nonomuraea zeae]
MTRQRSGLLSAIVAGLPATLAGAAVYGLLIGLTEYEIGLATIGVGTLAALGVTATRTADPVTTAGRTTGLGITTTGTADPGITTARSAGLGTASARTTDPDIAATRTTALGGTADPGITTAGPISLGATSARTADLGVISAARTADSLLPPLAALLGLAGAALGEVVGTALLLVDLAGQEGLPMSYATAATEAVTGFHALIGESPECILYWAVSAITAYTVATRRTTRRARKHARTLFSPTPANTPPMA